jgi:REP element-mobilizing transposase RayT
MSTKYNSEIHLRRSIRLKNYDYNQPGAYFITICVQNRECLFGDIQDGTVQLNTFGQIVNQLWCQLPAHFPDVEIDAAVIMPNHFHGIIVITRRGLVSKPSNSESLMNKPSAFYQLKTQLGKIIAYFKYQTTKLINQARDLQGCKIWQKNYYEHIIRNHESLEILRNYVLNNPRQWETDQLYPNNPFKW